MVVTFKSVTPVLDRANELPPFVETRNPAPLVAAKTVVSWTKLGENAMAVTEGNGKPEVTRVQVEPVLVDLKIPSAPVPTTRV